MSKTNNNLIFLRRFVILLFIGFTQLIIGQTNTKLEESKAFINTIEIAQDETANNSAFLKLKEKGVVKWNVVLPETGNYNIHIRYRAFNGSKEQFFLKNNDTIPIGFSMAESWKEFTQPFYFHKGLNTIGLQESWGHMDIDWFMLSETQPKVNISPKKQIFVKDINLPLVFKIDNFHQNIENVLLNDIPIKYSLEFYPYEESAVWLGISEEELNKFEEGDYQLKVVLKSSFVLANLSIMNSAEESKLTIIVPDVEHGSSVFMRLPSGKNLLIDSGKDWVRDSIVIPMLKRLQIDTIHTFIITHYHGDHDSGDRGALIKSQFNVQQFIDYTTFPTGFELKQDGVSIKFLNTDEDGDEENTKSLAFKISYNGFIYYHSADNYSGNQSRIIEKYPNDIKANVFYANHHFHGSLLPEFIIKSNPDIVLVQAQEAVYARSAYMENYRKNVLQKLNANRETTVETLLGLEVGATVISVNNGEDWWYRTHKNQHALFAPELLINKHEGTLKLN